MMRWLKSHSKFVKTKTWFFNSDWPWYDILMRKKIALLNLRVFGIRCAQRWCRSWMTCQQSFVKKLIDHDFFIFHGVRFFVDRFFCWYNSVNGVQPAFLVSIKTLRHYTGKITAFSQKSSSRVPDELLASFLSQLWPFLHSIRLLVSLEKQCSTNQVKVLKKMHPHFIQ